MFFRTSVLNFSGLFKALESSDIFAQNVEFYIYYLSHFDVAEVGILSGIRNYSNGKCVVCRITDGERNAVNGNSALVHREIAFSCHFLIELIFESKISRAISVFHSDTFGSLVHMSLYDMTIQTAVHHHRTLYVHLVAYLEQSQVAAVQGFLHGGNDIRAIFYFHYGEAHTIMSHALIEAEFINERALQRKVMFSLSCLIATTVAISSTIPLNIISVLI